MTKAELEKLAGTYRQKAEAAYQAYQETGMTRYSTQRRKNEDLADALSMALNVKDEHDKLTHLRGVLSELAERVILYARLSGVYR